MTTTRSPEETTLSDFMTEFEARVILLVVPDGVPTAARVSVSATVDASTQYAGELDESTETTITVSATGYAEDGKQLWSYSRDYDQFTGFDRNDPSAPHGLMRLIADLAATDSAIRTPDEAAGEQSSPRLLMDAETADPIGEATPAQIRASDEAGDTGIILIDADGDVIGPEEEHQPFTPKPVRRVYVED